MLPHFVHYLPMSIPMSILAFSFLPLPSFTLEPLSLPLPYSMTGLTHVRYTEPLTAAGTFLSHRTPVTFLYPFHPADTLSIVEPKYLNSVTFFNSPSPMLTLLSPSISVMCWGTCCWGLLWPIDQLLLLKRKEAHRKCYGQLSWSMADFWPTFLQLWNYWKAQRPQAPHQDIPAPSHLHTDTLSCFCWLAFYAVHCESPSLQFLENPSIFISVSFSLVLDCCNIIEVCTSG